MLPKGWESYSHIGDVIPGTRIVAFKTPLRDNYFNSLPQDMTDDPKCDRFTPVDVCEAVLETSEGRHNLGLVINLTFTSKYYDPAEFIKNGVYFTKIMCPGHQIPHEGLVYDFQECILSYLHDYPDPYTVVGVHCTHGVNRTGYMISRYLIQCEGWDPEQAIEAVGTARGHTIERENYLEHLQSLHRPPRNVPSRRHESPNRPKRRKSPNRPKRHESPNRPKRHESPNRPKRHESPNLPRRHTSISKAHLQTYGHCTSSRKRKRTNEYKKHNSSSDYCHTNENESEEPCGSAQKETSSPNSKVTRHNGFDDFIPI